MSSTSSATMKNTATCRAMASRPSTCGQHRPPVGQAGGAVGEGDAAQLGGLAVHQGLEELGLAAQVLGLAVGHQDVVDALRTSPWSKGLLRKPMAPSSRDSERVSRSVWAVSTTTGGAITPSRQRIWRSTSKPDRCGMRMSSSTRSGRQRLISGATVPRGSVMPSRLRQPASSRMSSSSSTLAGVSSTTRMWASAR